MRRLLVAALGVSLCCLGLGCSDTDVSMPTLESQIAQSLSVSVDPDRFTAGTSLEVTVTVSGTLQEARAVLRDDSGDVVAEAVAQGPSTDGKAHLTLAIPEHALSPRTLALTVRYTGSDGEEHTVQETFPVRGT